MPETESLKLRSITDTPVQNTVNKNMGIPIKKLPKCNSRRSIRELRLHTKTQSIPKKKKGIPIAQITE